VAHLYERAGVGTKVIVKQGGPGTLFTDNGAPGIALFGG
jgi:hypothetical protein